MLNYEDVPRFQQTVTRSYALVQFKCPNCNSFRLKVDTFQEMEPAKFTTVPYSKLNSVEELSEEGHSDTGEA
jgi:hypothetical protein